MTAELPVVNLECTLVARDGPVVLEPLPISARSTSVTSREIGMGVERQTEP